MFAFIDQSGNPHPNDQDRGAVLVAVCMRELTLFELSRRLHSIKNRYGWMSGGEPKEIHSKDCATDAAFKVRNRPHESRWRVYSAAIQTVMDSEVAVFVVLLPRPTTPPSYPRYELPSQYFFLLQRLEALATRWREANVTVVFDEENRGRDRIRAFSFAHLLQNYWNGYYFTRVTPTALFGDSAALPGLEVADLVAYTVFVDEFARLRTPPPANDYLARIGSLRSRLQGKSLNLVDHRNTTTTFHGFYRMPERFYRSRPPASGGSSTP